MRSSLLFACAVLLLAALSSSQAAEVPDTEALELLKQGNALLTKRQFDQALAKFEQAAKLSGSPKLFFNKAQALTGLGRDPEAMQAYQQFLDEAKDAAAGLRGEAERQAVALSARLGRIELTCNRTRASILVDEQERGTTPLGGPIWVKPGEHAVTARWQQQEKRERVLAPAGTAVRLAIELAPVPGRVHLTSNRDGARAIVDDKEVGLTPLGKALELPPGEHALTLTWQKEERVRRFSVSEGAVVSLAVDFADAPPPSLPAPPPAAEPWYRSRWVWIAAGAVVVAAGTTTALLLYGGRDQYPETTLGTQRIGE